MVMENSNQKQINNSNNKKFNPKKIIVHVQTANGDCSSFSVLIKRHAKVGKLQGKIKKQLGVAKVDQRLQLLPSRRDMQAEEVLDSLLTQDQVEISVSLVVLGPNSIDDQSGQTMRKPLAKNKKKQVPSVVSSSAASPSLVPFVEEKSSVVEPNSISPFVSSSSLFSSPLKTTGDNNNAVIIKISFEEHHRRLPFEQRADVSFERLTNACTQFFGIKNVHRMVLSYEDEDGDRVQLSTDAELAYALDHYTDKKKSSRDGDHEGLPVLRLRFAVKAVKKQQQDDETSVLPPSSSSSLVGGFQAPFEKEKGVCHLQRKLQDGDVIVLQAQREGEAYNVAFCKKDQSIVAARQAVPSSSNDDNDKKGNSPFFRKNAQWVVSKFKSSEETDGNEEEIFFLSCKAFDDNKKNLRVLSNGSANHQGGRGVWARFAIVQSSSPSSGQQLVTLRCLGRSKSHPENSFLGIRKNKNKDNKNASSAQRPFVVAGDLNQNSDDTKFTLHFV